MICSSLFKAPWAREYLAEWQASTVIGCVVAQAHHTVAQLDLELLPE